MTDPIKLLVDSSLMCLKLNFSPFFSLQESTPAYKSPATTNHMKIFCFKSLNLKSSQTEI